MGKNANKLAKLDPLRGGDVVHEKLGLPDMLGEQTEMLTADVYTAEQMAKLEAPEEARRQQAESNVDLVNRDVLEVVQEAAADQAALAKRKQRQQSFKPSTNILRSLGF